MSVHTHTCCVCGFVYPCAYAKLKFGPVEKCKVTQAVTVNKGGPYCVACLNLEMARRYIEGRGGKLTFSIDYSPLPSPNS